MDESVFDRAKAYAEDLFKDDSSGHDIYHTIRVHNLAVSICREEHADMDVVRLASLLHDVDDPKLFDTPDYGNARSFMDSENICPDTQDHVIDIIRNLSFKGSDSVTPSTLEGRIVQDADRMDAIGAIGIARAFAYGGSRGRAIHIPGEGPKENMSAEEYFANKGTSINHFYEKLLLLKDMMNTPTAKNMAQARHEFMASYLDEFYAEWDGKA